MKNTTLLLNDANEILNGLAYKYTELKNNEVPLIDSLTDFKGAIIYLLRMAEGDEFSTPILIYVEKGVEIKLDDEVFLSVNEKYKDLAEYFLCTSEHEYGW